MKWVPSRKRDVINLPSGIYPFVYTFQDEEIQVLNKMLHKLSFVFLLLLQKKVYVSKMIIKSK